MAPDDDDDNENMNGERKVIHPLSGVAPLPQFELWSVPPTQISVEKDIETEVRPLSTLAANQPIEFHVSSSVDEYINLSETYLYIKARVILTKDDRRDAGVSDWNSVIPANYFMHALFSQCEVKLGDKEITLAPQTYSYRAFIEALLGYSADAKKTVLSGSLWTETDAERTKIVKNGSASGTGKEGKRFDMMGRLHTDLTFQDKCLLGGVDLKIRLIPNTSKFYFKCDNGLTPELELGEVTLLVHKAKTYPSLVSSHAAALANYPARYPITRCEVRQQGIPKGQLDAMLENVIRGQMPRRMFVMMQETEILNGTFNTDPFSFKHCDIDFMAAYIDGVQYPTRPYTPNFTDKLCTREYMELFIALNQNRTDTYATLDKETFIKDMPIFAFNFSPDLSNGPGASGHVNTVSQGSLRLRMRFKRQLTKAMNVLLYSEFDNMIEIDANRNVLTDYN